MTSLSEAPHLGGAISSDDEEQSNLTATAEIAIIDNFRELTVKIRRYAYDSTCLVRKMKRTGLNFKPRMNETWDIRSQIPIWLIRDSKIYILLNGRTSPKGDGA